MAQTLSWLGVLKTPVQDELRGAREVVVVVDILTEVLFGEVY
jgi:hypothetical protein